MMGVKVGDGRICSDFVHCLIKISVAIELQIK